jgi:hypothetical protein
MPDHVQTQLRALANQVDTHWEAQDVDAILASASDRGGDGDPGPPAVRPLDPGAASRPQRFPMISVAAALVLVLGIGWLVVRSGDDDALESTRPTATTTPTTTAEEVPPAPVRAEPPAPTDAAPIQVTFSPEQAPAATVRRVEIRNDGAETYVECGHRYDLYRWEDGAWAPVAQLDLSEPATLAYAFGTGIRGGRCIVGTTIEPGASSTATFDPAGTTWLTPDLSRGAFVPGWYELRRAESMAESALPVHGRFRITDDGTRSPDPIVGGIRALGARVLWPAESSQPMVSLEDAATVFALGVLGDAAPYTAETTDRNGPVWVTFEHPGGASTRVLFVPGPSPERRWYVLQIGEAGTVTYDLEAATIGFPPGVGTAGHSSIRVSTDGVTRERLLGEDELAAGRVRLEVEDPGSLVVVVLRDGAGNVVRVGGADLTVLTGTTGTSIGAPTAGP